MLHLTPAMVCTAPTLQSGALLGACYLLGALWGISCGLFSVGWDLAGLLTGRNRKARRACLLTQQPQQQPAAVASSTAPADPQPPALASAPQATAAKPPTTPTPAEKPPAPAEASPPFAKPISGAHAPAGPVTAAGRVETTTEADADAKAVQAADAGRAWLARQGQQQPAAAAEHTPGVQAAPTGNRGAAAVYAPDPNAGALEREEQGAWQDDGEQSEGGSSTATTCSFFTATSADAMSRRSDSPVTPVAGTGAVVNGHGAGNGEQAAPAPAAEQVGVAGTGGGGEGQAAAARPAHKRSHGQRRGGAKGAAR